MKTQLAYKRGHFLLRIMAYAYADQIIRLEARLARKPSRLQIDLIGSDEMSPDTVLLLRSIFLKRDPQTHITTCARSSLQGASVLLWLLGDTRIVREDVKMFFRKSWESADDDDDDDDWQDEPTGDDDIEEAAYQRVLELINQFIPVREFVGRTFGLSELQQFGLVDSEHVDRFLHSAFGQSNHPGNRNHSSTSESAKLAMHNTSSEGCKRASDLVSVANFDPSI